MKVIFIRYGEHTDGHLSEQGRRTMMLISEHLKLFVQKQKVSIICADVPRAIESADVVSKNLNIFPVNSFKELYAAPEHGIATNLETAAKIIYSLGKENDIVIAVISREYIEDIPGYILSTLGVEKVEKIRLNRGEALVLDYNNKTITKF